MGGTQKDYEIHAINSDKATGGIFFWVGNQPQYTESNVRVYAALK